ncbi:MAG: hypothetical protein ACI9Y1_001019 [Lentisphaeria bacterium]|jgi:hypothetical protein
MDQESIVYGCIKDISDYRKDVERRAINRQSMLALPKSEDWPYVSREMFAIPRIEVSADNYQTEVMHFGASYKAIEYEWKEWMKHFESLLDSMYWVSAIVHLETELAGVHTFTWESKNNGHTPGSGINQVHCEWTQEQSFL